MKRKKPPPATPYGATADAERELDAILAHAEFERRMGCPADIVAAGVRERVVEFIAEHGDIEDLRYELRESEAERGTLEKENEDLRREVEDFQRQIEVLESK